MISTSYRTSQWSKLFLFMTILIIMTFMFFPINSLVTNMVNATTSEMQEQWLIFHTLSQYGPQESFNITSQAMIPSDPTLCFDNPTYNFTNKIVLATRGNCSFYDKSFLAQKYNSTGVVIGNIDDGALIMMSYDQLKNTTEITIPTMMIRHSPFEYIVAMTNHSQPYPPSTSFNTLSSSSSSSHGLTRSNSLIQNSFLNSFSQTIFPSTTRHRNIQSFPSQKSYTNNNNILTSTDSIPNGTNTISVASLWGPVTIPSDTYELTPQSSFTTTNSNNDDNDDFNLTPSLSPSIMANLFQSNIFITDSIFPTTLSKSSSQNTMSSTQLQVDPFDPDDPDAGPYYFSLTMDSRGQSYFPYFPIEQIQFLLIALVIAPLLWILFLLMRWLRLYWGFRCVEELVTNTASHLPLCTYIQTDEQGNIIFDSGEGTAANNLADLMAAQQQQKQQQPNIKNDDHDSKSSTTPIQSYGTNEQHTPLTINSSATTSSTSNLFSSDNNSNNNNNNNLYFNTRTNRYVVTTPSHELYEQIKSTPTVSHTYVAQSLTSPNYQTREESKHLTFRTKTTNSKDTGSMSYLDVNTQSISIIDHKTHMRVHSDTCNICLEPFITGDQVKLLGCYHAFHPACIDHYFNSTSNGQSQVQIDEATRQEQRRTYAMMYLQSSYDFDELANDPDITDTNNNNSNSNSTLPQRPTPASNNPHMGQACPVCRRSILQTARMNSIIKKKWWIYVFEWLCMCSCCCPTWRRERRRRNRQRTQTQRPILVEVDEEANYNPTAYRYSYQVSRRSQSLSTSTAQPEHSTSTTTHQQQQPQQQRPTHTTNHGSNYDANDYSY